MDTRKIFLKIAQLNQKQTVKKKLTQKFLSD